MRNVTLLFAVIAAGLTSVSCGPPQPPDTTPPPRAPGPTASASVSTSTSTSTKTLRYSAVALSRPAGGAVTTVRADGTRETAYAYVENGRGPKMTVKLAVDPSGALRSFDATGTETMGNPIDEHFSFDGAKAQWANRSEKGSAAAPAASFYVPLTEYPETVGLLARALLKSGSKLPLLPGGEARIEKTAETMVRGAAGEKHVTGYAIYGLEVLPTRLWMDDDGDLFGMVDAWWSFIREGWEAAIDPLVAVQKQLHERREEELAKRLAKKPPGAFAFTHARVFDADAKKWLVDHTVVFAGGKITAIGPSATTKPPAGAETVDVDGKTVMPGLWDMHAHLSPGDGELNIASGVTTARDLGNDPDRLDRFKARFDDGSAIGPHVVRAGFIEGRGEKAAGSKVTAETEAEAIAAVDLFAKRGYDQIKIYNSVKPELVPILAREAHAKGLRVSGHIPVHMRAEEAVRAGYDEIQHVNMLFLNFFVDKETDTRTTLRFSLVADKAPGLDLQSKPVKDFVKLLVEKKTVIDPTLCVFESLFTAREGQMNPSYVAVADRLPVQVRRGYLTGGLVVPEGKDAFYKQSFTRAKELVKILHGAGVPIVPGTDALVGFTLQRELEIYVEAGLPADDVLQIATLGSARVTKRDKTTGSIKVGKDADLIVIDGDPHARMADIRKVVTTVRGGVVFASRDVYEGVGIRP